MSERDPISLAQGLTPPPPRRGVGRAEIAALVVSVLWALFCILLRLGSDVAWTGPAALIWMAGLVVPILLIWLGVGVIRLIQTTAAEAAQLRMGLSALSSTASLTTSGPTPGLGETGLSTKLDAVMDAQNTLQAQIIELGATLHGQQPAMPQASEPQAAAPEPDAQPSLSLGTPAEALNAPITIPEFIQALNFPETEQDAEGFAVLRKALRDRSTQKLVRASQDALTLLSQDGIYMDDLRPDRARPEVWRAFARGERGRAIAGLGGVHDRSGLALAAGRMKQDPIFKDVVHHFLRAFDQTFMEFERHASDEDIIRLADTRTARAFMLLGRVTGTFD